MKAHDVRRLAICPCGKMGDSREMIAFDGQLWHDDCAYHRLGEGVLGLPASERGKFKVSTLPVELMRRLLEIDPGKLN